MSKIIRGLGAAAFTAAMLAAPTVAHADPDDGGTSWGQQIQQCKAAGHCENSRGEYTSGKAKDGRGFADNLHNAPEGAPGGSNNSWNVYP